MGDLSKLPDPEWHAPCPSAQYAGNTTLDLAHILLGRSKFGTLGLRDHTNNRREVSVHQSDSVFECRHGLRQVRRGMLSAATQRNLRSRALREVVTPILETILTAPKSSDTVNDISGMKGPDARPELFRSRA